MILLRVVKEITSIVDGPISAEVVSMEHEKMVEEALELAKIHSNIVIKDSNVYRGTESDQNSCGKGNQN